MSGRNKISLALAAFLVLFLLSIPQVSFAAVTPPGDDCVADATGASAMDQFIVNKQAAAFQIKAAKQGNLLALFPAITSDAILCLNNIKAALDQIDNFQGSMSMAGTILQSMLSNFILSYLTGICQSVVGDIKNIQNFVNGTIMNAICVPTLNLSFGNLPAANFQAPQCGSGTTSMMRDVGISPSSSNPFGSVPTGPAGSYTVPPLYPLMFPAGGSQ